MVKRKDKYVVCITSEVYWEISRDFCMAQICPKYYLKKKQFLCAHILKIEMISNIWKFQFLVLRVGLQSVLPLCFTSNYICFIPFSLLPIARLVFLLYLPVVSLYTLFNNKGVFCFVFSEALVGWSMLPLKSMGVLPWASMGAEIRPALSPFENPTLNSLELFVIYV